MTTSGLITRPILGLSDLSIVDDPYDVIIDGLNVGPGTWRRATAESPFVSGRVLAGAVLDVATRSFQIDVAGTSLEDVQTNIGTLIAAVSQFSYELSLTLDTGATYRWACEPADWAVGFTFQHVLGLIAPVSLLIPTSPLPVTGPI